MTVSSGSQFLLAMGILFPLAGTCMAGNYDVHVLVKSGDAISGKVLIDVFPPGSISNSGTVAFTACSLGGCGVFTQERLVAFSGDIIDGRPIFVFFSGGPAINNSGDVAFFAAFPPGGTGIFLKQGARAKRIAATGDVIGGKIISTLFGTLALNNSGTVAFNAGWVGGSPPQFGFFTQHEALALLGESVIDGHVLTGLDLAISLNEPGGTVFAANYSDSGGGGGIATPTQWVVKSGDVLGGITFFGAGASPSINNAGTVAFPADTNIGNGIFTQFEPVARIGDLISGRTLNAFLIKPVINNAGEVVFLANAFTPGFGVFTAKDLVVGVGDTVDGRVITDFTIAPPAVNDRGDIAIRASFQDGSAGILLARRTR
jgi:hypothetical protein